MSESFSFEWKLFDQVSGPASKIEASLQRAERALRGAGSTARTSTDSWALFGLKVGAVSGIVHSITDAVIGLGRSAIGYAAAGGKYALEAASFNENTKVALGAVLGSKEAVTEAVNEWRAFAAVTPFKTKEIFEWGEAFRIAGLSARDTMTLLQGTSDVGGLNQFDPQKGRDFVESILTLNARGRLDERELMRFARLHIPEQKILHNIATLLGVSDEQARELERQGQITGRAAIIGILRTIRDIGGGKLGKLTELGSQTFSGLLSTVESRPFELLMGLDKSKGFAALKGVLKNIADVLDPDRPSGKRIQKMLMQIGDSIGDWLKPISGRDGKKTIEDFFKAVIDGAKGAMESVGILASGFLAVMRFLKNTGEFTGQAAAAVRTIFSDDGGAAKHEAAKFLMEGVFGSEPFVPPNLNALTPEARARFYATTPGRFSEADETGTGFRVPPLLARPPARTITTGPISFKNTFHLPAGPWAEDSLAQKIAELQTEQLTSTLEKLATQAGE